MTDAEALEYLERKFKQGFGNDVEKWAAFVSEYHAAKERAWLALDEPENIRPVNDA